VPEGSDPAAEVVVPVGSELAAESGTGVGRATETEVGSETEAATETAAGTESENGTESGSAAGRVTESAAASAEKVHWLGSQKRVRFAVCDVVGVCSRAKRSTHQQCARGRGAGVAMERCVSAAVVDCRACGTRGAGCQTVPVLAHGHVAAPETERNAEVGTESRRVAATESRWVVVTENRCAAVTERRVAVTESRRVAVTESAKVLNDEAELVEEAATAVVSMSETESGRGNASGFGAQPESETEVEHAAGQLTARASATEDVVGHACEAAAVEAVPVSEQTVEQPDNHIGRL
jgi:hypothetical protein